MRCDYDLYEDARDAEYESNLRYGICEACGEECHAITADHGIGAYEYWGFKGVHHEYVEESPCCGAEVVDGGTKILRTSTHTARRDHKDGKIKAGDRYRVTVTFHWRKDGPGWVTEEKRVLDAFKSAVKEAMAS